MITASQTMDKMHASRRRATLPVSSLLLTIASCALATARMVDCRSRRNSTQRSGPHLVRPWRQGANTAPSPCAGCRNGNAEAYAQWLAAEWQQVSAQLSDRVPARLLTDADRRLAALPHQYANADPRHRYKNNRQSAHYREGAQD